jgi:transcriptional regulator with XRE-family HTH domain
MELGKFIGERVRQRRKALGMTQEQLEAASGVPQGSISRIESGVAEDVYASTVLGFAQALQVSTDYLLGVAPLEQAPSQSMQPPAKRQRPRKATPVA